MLDAYTALTGMITLNDVPRAGRTIITTIQKTAYEIFDTFHSLLLLHQGKDAFFGAAKDAISHFEQLGVVCPPQVRQAPPNRPTASAPPRSTWFRQERRGWLRRRGNQGTAGRTAR